MPTVVAILALIVGGAGWYYLFYSKAARRLAGVEAATANGRRHRLRRANGAVMLVLGGLFYAGFALDPDRSNAARAAWAIVWSVVFLLVLVMLALVLLDLRLTAKLRRTPKP